MTYDEDTFASDLDSCLGEVRAMLLTKNAAYGDSALNPVRIFSKASADEQLLVRIDDKLSRLARGDSAGEDVIHDLLGYLVLYRIAQRRRAAPIDRWIPTITHEQQAVVIEQSSGSFAPFVGPFVGKRVESPLEEKHGHVVVDDGNEVKVQWEGESDLATFSLKIFQDGIKQKWLLWVEDGAEPTYVVAAEKEQKNDSEEKEAE